jgi:hypothetical protein
MILELPREVKRKLRPFGHRRKYFSPYRPFAPCWSARPAPVFLFLASSQFAGQADRRARPSSFS